MPFPFWLPFPPSILWTSDSRGSVLPFSCRADPSGMRTDWGVLGLISKGPYAKLTLPSCPRDSLGPAVASPAGLSKFRTRPAGEPIYSPRFACRVTAVSLVKAFSSLIWSSPRCVLWLCSFSISWLFTSEFSLYLKLKRRSKNRSVFLFLTYFLWYENL